MDVKLNNLKKMLGKADDKELYTLFNESLKELQRRETNKALEYASKFTK